MQDRLFLIDQPIFIGMSGSMYPNGYIVKVMDENNNIAERFSEERSRLEISQDDLAKLCGITRNTIYKYENGKAYPKADVLAAFMKAGADVYYILLGRRVDEPQPVMLAPDEVSVVHGYRASDAAGKEQIRLYVNAVTEHCVRKNTSPLIRKRIDKKQPK